MNPFTTQTNTSLSKSFEKGGDEPVLARSSPVKSNKDLLKSSPSFENFQDRDLILSQPPKPESVGRSPLQEPSPIKNKTLKDIIEKTPVIPASYQGYSSQSGPEEINMDNLESKINDLISTLQRRNRNEPEPIYYGDSNSDNSQNVKLLKLEIDKNRELTENIKLLEAQLAKADQMYDQLEKQ